MITIGILKEPSFESRVSLLASEVNALVKNGITVWIEAGAGIKAFCTDKEYKAVGASIIARGDITDKADILLSINSNEIDASE